MEQVMHTVLIGNLGSDTWCLVDDYVVVLHVHAHITILLLNGVSFVQYQFM